MFHTRKAAFPFIQELVGEGKAWVVGSVGQDPERRAKLANRLIIHEV